MSASINITGEIVLLCVTEAMQLLSRKGRNASVVGSERVTEDFSFRRR